MPQMTMKRKSTCYFREKDRLLRRLKAIETWALKEADWLRKERSRKLLTVKTLRMLKLKSSENFSKKSLERSRERLKLLFSLQLRTI